MAAATPPSAASGRFRGLTLVELMITVAVLAILATVAFPSFQRMLVERRVESAAEAAYQLARVGRAAALKTSSDIYLLSSTGQDWAVWLSPTYPCSSRTPATPCLYEDAVVRAASHPTTTLESSLTTPNVQLAFRTATIINYDNASATTMSLTWSAPTGLQLQLRMTREGSILICSPNNTSTRYAAC